MQNINDNGDGVLEGSLLRGLLLEVRADISSLDVEESNKFICGLLES